MDDQFNGRTDDDLFADDFEPVSESIPAPIPEPQPKAPVDSSQDPATEAQPATAPKLIQPSQPSPATNAPRTLAHSRHAKPAHQQRPRKHSPKKAAPSTTNTAPSDTGDAPNSSETPVTSSPALAATTVRPGSNTALADRLASGANPRTKLSESELAEKMERMRILSAEKARKFEQAEQDSRSHALAYEKGMEEARRRRAEEAERRRRGEEERRQMDQERAANRERKLKAMGAREGGWDEGKSAEDEKDRRGFRGANGGIRGARNIRGAEAEEPIREFAPDEFRGRGRGRGRGGVRGGRGGRGGFADRQAADATSHHQPQKKQPEQTPPTADDFPALPPAAKVDTTVEAAKPISLSPGLNSPPIGKWDDEMAALDATS
ncbi:hypothetical protein F5B22DRAFT_609211 [Xylaria bambusicola]|uniref:uncharacterized protein n=1 Tax=Xylaria bambusicola TaxID=326684 RepID=UPI002007AE58|nr:uncharacterized protein F5B22DRAFT_609211 [Xylaria bambusicola]KAI0514973.1 hypothetical protein F5B22DRAFT_609211 [Xylaria bambusicola]